MKTRWGLYILAAGLALAWGQGQAPRELAVTVGKSLVLDSPVDVQRVAVANPAVVEAVGVAPREVVLNGKTAGQTSVILWQRSGQRLLFDVTVNGLPDQGQDGVRRALERELPGQQVSVEFENNRAYLHGVVNELAAADRAEAIAASLGKDVHVVNLLRVKTPAAEPQILLKVRFADVDRSTISELGANWISTGAANTPGSITTGQFAAPRLDHSNNSGTQFNISDVLNVFLFRHDLDLGATIRALQSRRAIQMLAEPNVLAANGRPASFLAGGEFPFPVIQGGGAGFTGITIQWREYGVRLNFTPHFSPRGAIRLEVAPEVSSLDFANGLTIQGYSIPSIAARRVATEIELEDKQSFAIAGLLDNRVTEQLSRVPGIGDIPFFGKLFRSRAANKNKSELLVLVTPEIVYPMPEGAPQPGVSFEYPFLEKGAKEAPRTAAGQAPAARPERAPRPGEVLKEQMRKEQEDKKAGSAATAAGADRPMAGGRR